MTAVWFCVRAVGFFVGIKNIGANGVMEEISLSPEGKILTILIVRDILQEKVREFQKQVRNDPFDGISELERLAKKLGMVIPWKTIL